MGKSYLLENINPQDIVDKYVGTGLIKRDKNGRWTKKEFVDTDNIIGFIVDETTGKSIKTNRISISYSKEEGVHIVPRKK